MRKPAPALLPIFRSQLQAQLLSWLYLRADDEFTLSQLAKTLEVSPGALHAEVDRLVTASVLSDRRVGRSRLVRANTAARIARPLGDLLLITYGPEWVISDEFASISGVEQVVIYGSWARRYRGEAGREPADIDVMVIGNTNRDSVYKAAERSEKRLGMPVNSTVRSMDAWHASTDALVLTAKKDALVIIDRLGDTE